MFLLLLCDVTKEALQCVEQKQFDSQHTAFK